MTTQAVFEAIRERFRTEVAVPQSLAVVYDNAPDLDGIVSAWCRLVLQVDSANQVAAGSVRYRTTGSALAVLYAPSAKGDKVVLDLADAVIAAFRGARIASPDVSFVPAPSVIGAGDQTDAWHSRSVRIPFRYDEVAA